MSNTNFQPSEKRNIREMSRAEILQLFAWYDFKDALGHKLINCQDFIELVESRILLQAESKVRETTKTSL